MSYTPSDAAVEAPARAIFKADHEDSGRTWDSEDAGTHEWYYGLARAALVALMGATVTEPCANPECVNGLVDVPTTSPDFYQSAPCPDCPAPRSLAVQECERAGRLEGMNSGVVARHPNIAPRFLEVPPTEESTPTLNSHEFNVPSMSIQPEEEPCDDRGDDVQAAVVPATGTTPTGFVTTAETSGAKKQTPSSTARLAEWLGVWWHSTYDPDSGACLAGAVELLDLFCEVPPTEETR